MIKETVGDVLKADANVICHQVNCKGVMGAGVAKQIKDKMLSSVQFNLYREHCKQFGSEALGSVLWIPVALEPKKYIANLFGEDIPTGKGLDTNYDALRLCLEKVEHVAHEMGWTVAIPGLIGCGLAGGDWDYVLNSIIKPIFEKSDVELTIVYWENN